MVVVMVEGAAGTGDTAVMGVGMVEVAAGIGVDGAITEGSAAEIAGAREGACPCRSLIRT